MRVRRVGKRWEAYHEAGHAVVASLLRIRVNWVCLTPWDPARRGHVCYSGSHRLGAKWCKSNKNKVTADMAGMAAEVLLIEAESGIPNHIAAQIMVKRRAGTSDLRSAAELAADYSEDTPATLVSSRLAECGTGAVQLLSSHWAAVGAVADLLLNKATLNGAMVRRIIRESQTAV
jgi:ATP-dependent Zn protease